MNGSFVDRDVIEVAVRAFLQVGDGADAAVEDRVGDFGRIGRVELHGLDVETVVVTEEHRVGVGGREDVARVGGDGRGRAVDRKVAVGVDRIYVAAAEAVALVEVPAVVAALLDLVQLLPVARAGVLGHGLAVGQEREPERVPEAVRVDGRLGAGDVYEGVVRRDASVEVEAVDLAVAVGQDGGVGDGGVVVADAEPQLSIRADVDIVDGVMEDLQLVATPVDDFTRKARGRAAAGDGEPRQLRVEVDRRVGHVHVAVGREVRIEGQAEDAGLSSGVGRDCDHGRALDHASAVQQDRPFLLGDVDVAIRPERDGRRVLEPFGQLHLGKPDRQVGKGGVGGRRDPGDCARSGEDARSGQQDSGGGRGEAPQQGAATPKANSRRGRNKAGYASGRSRGHGTHRAPSVETA